MHGFIQFKGYFIIIILEARSRHWVEINLSAEDEKKKFSWEGGFDVIRSDFWSFIITVPSIDQRRTEFPLEPISGSPKTALFLHTGCTIC